MAARHGSSRKRAQRTAFRLVFGLFAIVAALGAMPEDASAWAIYNCSGHTFDKGTVVGGNWEDTVPKGVKCADEVDRACHWTEPGCNPGGKRDSILTMTLLEDEHKFNCTLPVHGGGWVEIHETPADFYGVPNGLMHSQLWCRSWFDPDEGGPLQPFVHAVTPYGAQATERHVRFLATSDLHYAAGDDDPRRNQINHTVGTMLDSLKTEGNIRGIVVVGDTTELTRPYQEWKAYKSRIGGFNRFFFEGLGNHDSKQPDNVNEKTGCPGQVVHCVDKDAIVDDILGRYRPATLNYATGTHDYRWWDETIQVPDPHYSWDWHDVHFVQLNLKPSDEATLEWDNPMSALTFLRNDLAARVGTSGRPVVIFHHLDFTLATRPDDKGDIDFTEAERAAYWDAIAPYNVIAIYTGHLHSSTEGPDPARPPGTWADGHQHTDAERKAFCHSQNAPTYSHCLFPFGSNWKGSFTKPTGAQKTGPAGIPYYYTGPGYGDPEQLFGFYLDVIIDYRCKLGNTNTGEACLTTTQIHAPNNGGLALGRANATISFKERLIDAIAPTTTHTLNHTPNAHGWISSDVVDVTLTAVEDTNRAATGVRELTYCTSFLTCTTSTNASVSISIRDEGETTITYWATDNAGNQENAKTVNIKLDRTLPVVAGFKSPAPNAAGWNRSNVTVGWTCTDSQGGSGIDVDTVNDTVVSAEGESTASSAHGVCRDKAGNVAANATVPVKIDKTAPTISSELSPEPNADGWNNSDVTVGFTCSDAISGVAQDTLQGTTVTQEGAAQTASGSGTCSDNAGNVASSPRATVNLDKTAPTASLFSREPAPNQHGWNKTDVTVRFTCSDSVSGVSAQPKEFVKTEESANQSATGTCVDRAGNQASRTESAIHIDKTAPTVSVKSRLPAANANGWNKSDVTVSFACSDGLSGVDSLPTDVTLASEGANHSATGTCVDRAGNSQSVTQSSISIDKTAPKIALVKRDPMANAAGWNNTDVSLAWSCSDGLSGVVTDMIERTVSAEGSTFLEVSCHDLAGNSSSNAVTVHIDKKPPIIRYTGSTPDPPGPWYRTDVTLHWSCADALSGAILGADSVTLRLEGAGQSATGRCSDAAGNVSTSTRTSINIDKTPPTALIDPRPIPFAVNPVVTGSAQDNLSGVASVVVRFAGSSGEAIQRVATCTLSCLSTSTRWSASTAGLPPGYYRITATAIDVAGHRGLESAPLLLFIA